LLFWCVFFFFCCWQLYPFVVLVGGVLVWYKLNSRCIVFSPVCLGNMHIPFFLFCVYKLWWFWCRDYLSPSDIIASYPHLVVSGTGLAFGYLVVRYLFLFRVPEKMLFKASSFFSHFYSQLPVFMSLRLVTVLAGYCSLVSLFLGSLVNV
jgi:hypothetical protein